MLAGQGPYGARVRCVDPRRHEPPLARVPLPYRRDRPLGAPEVVVRDDQPVEEVAPRGDPREGVTNSSGSHEQQPHGTESIVDRSKYN
jgi:hypothetical protein